MPIRILHDFDPFLWQIRGSFGIRWYSIPYLLGFFLAWWLLRRDVRRDRIAGMDEDALYEYLVYLFAGVLVGARFFHVFVFEFADYGFDPVAWIAVWRGGMAFHGGLVGVAVGTLLFCRRSGVSLYALLDRLVVPAAFALGLGRVANFINGEMPGTRWDGPFCVDYSRSRYLWDPPEGCRHPTQLYEAVKEWAVGGLLVLEDRFLALRPGVLFWSFVTLYGLFRFPLMYLRAEPRFWGGMSLSQVFSGLQALVGIAFLVHLHRGRGFAPPREEGATGC